MNTNRWFVVKRNTNPYVVMMKRTKNIQSCTLLNLYYLWLHSRDAPNFQLAKMALKYIFGFQPKDFYNRNNTAKKGISLRGYHNSSKNRGLSESTKMSAVWTHFNISEYVCNAEISREKYTHGVCQHMFH